MSNDAIIIIIVLIICALGWRSERNAAQKKLDDIEFEKLLKNKDNKENDNSSIKNYTESLHDFVDKIDKK
jgi:amino acid permease